MEVVIRHGGLLFFIWAFILTATNVSGTLHKFHWSPDFNLTDWSSKQHFYVDDWLLFYYQEMKRMYNVLEVNETDYEWCRSDDPIRDFTGKAGRDVYHLQEAKPYYFISSGGYCFHGLKLQVLVQSVPPAASPPSPPTGNGSPSLSAFYNMIPAAIFGFAISCAL